ncbi:MAG: hypothetical protein C0435_16940, partial [Ralstonia sp.]|nr:hypothetical protein [Ralstonia sp.]MBA4297682.1 hypothetical protein [Ralstonia sp.]
MSAFSHPMACSGRCPPHVDRLLRAACERTCDREGWHAGAIQLPPGQCGPDQYGATEPAHDARSD